MLFIKHRCNTISQLRDISKDYGLEIDLRSYKKDLILNHEPFEKGILFRDWLKFYNHKFLILNVKEEGLEGWRSAHRLPTVSTEECRQWNV